MALEVVAVQIGVARREEFVWPSRGPVRCPVRCPVFDGEHVRRIRIRRLP